MIAYFARHPTAANLLMIVFVFLGLTTLPKIQRETLPDITPSQVSVSVVYPGASANEIEQSIVRRIEDVVEGIEFIKETTSECREGIGSVTLEMTTGGDLTIFREEIETAVSEIDDFPEDAEQPVVTEIGGTDQVLTIVVSADATAHDLYRHSKRLQQRLQKLPEVSLVDLKGISRPILSIDIRREELLHLGLSVNDVASALRAQNMSVPVGEFISRDQEFLLRLTENAESVSEWKSLVIAASASGREVCLGDIATLSILVDEDIRTFAEDRRACKLVIRKSKNDDIIQVADAVREFVHEEQIRYPEIQLTLTGDDSRLVRDRVELLVKNGLQGVVLVFVTLWLFLDWKLSFWVAASLPISFLGALFFFPGLGLSLNMFTLLAMLLALGILMDDGIVIAENIFSKRESGHPAMEAAVLGTSEVAAGVVSTFITTICVLGPLAFLSGRIGEVLCVIPIVLVLVLIVSLIEAFLILPSHLRHAISDRPRANRIRRAVDFGLDFVRDRLFGWLIDRAFCWRYLTLGITCGLLVGSIGLLASGVLRFLPFPPIEGDVVIARIVLPAGSPQNQTKAVVEKVLVALGEAERELERGNFEPEKLVKSTIIEYGVNSEAFDSGSHVATITVELLSVEQRTTRIDALVNLWESKIGTLPDVVWISLGPESFGPAGRPIEVRLTGDDLSELKMAATETQSWFQQFNGTRNVTHDLRKGKPELAFGLVSGANGLGLTTAIVSEQVRASVQGVNLGESMVNDEPYDVKVRMWPGDIDHRSDIAALPISLPNGRQTWLSMVTQRRMVSNWSRIARVNRQRTVTVRGDVDPDIISGSELVRTFKLQKAAELESRYPGVRFAFAGETQESSETASSLAIAAAIGLVGVYVLLSFQFRNYFEPLVVMTAIPLSAIGVIWGHWLTGIEMTMPSALGFVSLAGIVVNDSILLVLFLKTALSNGTTVEKAANEASRARFRAILLTSLTTIAGLLPLLFETDMQAQVLIPMATSVAFGIMTSTLLVLVVVPCLYGVLSDIGLSRSPRCLNSV